MIYSKKSIKLSYKMVRYIGPKLKITRRLGLLPGLTRKKIKLRKRTPGQHGKLRVKKTARVSLKGDYSERLFQKQRLRFNYGITENQLLSYYKRAKKKSAVTGTLLLQFLESRLDCLIYRLGFAASIPAARQLIAHRHIIVNKKIVNIPGFLCQKGDVIGLKKGSKSKPLVKSYFQNLQQKRNLILKRLKQVKRTTRYTSKILLPPHLRLIKNKLSGIFFSPIKRKNIPLSIKELKVVEYYSK
jgi:small subunit ribosomal protein S4